MITAAYSTEYLLGPERYKMLSGVDRPGQGLETQVEHSNGGVCRNLHEWRLAEQRPALGCDVRKLHT